jgi:peptidoglycan/LPS O-acetylase OafA/YrhL
MMGLYRLILALVVVLFHFGGLPSLSGRTAVFGFFALSGYLMVMVIEKVYSKMRFGSVNFYINRALRIYPIYIFYLLLMVSLIFLRGSTGFNVDPNEQTFYLVNNQIQNYTATQYFSETVFGLDISKKTLINAHSPAIIPQAWSLSIEMLFYLTAPFLVFFIRRKWVCPLLLSAALGYIVLTFYLGLPFDDYRYKSFLGSYFMFLIGGLIYRFRDNIPNIPSKIYLFVFGIALWIILLLTVFSGDATDLHFYILIVILVGITLVVTQPDILNESYKKLDRKLGDLSYGVFLNHFVAAFSLLTLVDYLRIITGQIYPLGRINTIWFGVYVCILSVFLAIFTHEYIEKPIERIREKVHHSQIVPDGVQIKKIFLSISEYLKTQFLSWKWR